MISSELRQRVLSLAAVERSLTRSEARRATWIALMTAMIASGAIFALADGVRPTGRPLALVLATGTLACVVAAGASWIAVRRGGGETDARPRDVLAALIVVVPVVLVVGKLALSAAWAGMTEPWPDRTGFRCLGLFLALGAAPLAAYLWIWRLREVRRPGLQGAALGVTAGAGAWTLLDMWCPAADPAHLALGHVLPLALLAAAGMSWRWVRRP
jgi:hypothetical protein